MVIINILWSDSEKMIKYSTEFLQNNLIKKDTKNQKYFFMEK
jgi:trimethyllysine dioxygenase